MHNLDVLTVGGAVRDITFYTSQGKLFATPHNLTAQKMLGFEYGAKIPVSEAYHSVGGGAANTAVALSRLGLRTAVVVRIGKDEDGQEIVAEFKRQKVKTDFIQRDRITHTGFSFIVSVDKKEREHVAFLYRGANANLTLSGRTLQAIRPQWLYLSSLSSRQWTTGARQLFRLARTGHTQIAWNPGYMQLQTGKRLMAEFLSQTDVLILNKDEAIELVLSGIKVGRRNPNYLNKPLYLLNILRDWGPRIVVITAGQKGAWAYDEKRIYFQKTKPGKVVDTTGVGDAFGSTFIAGLRYGKGDIAKALQWAATNAASVCTKIGAHNGLLTLAELKKRL